MKPSDIKVGKTYVNRGAGRTERTVSEIVEPENFQASGEPPMWFGAGDAPTEPYVVFSQDGRRDSTLYVSSFAAWAGKEKP